MFADTHDFARKKTEGEPIVMTTCYDAWSAALLARSEVDAILVGDSAAMVMHGYDSTIPIDVEQMAIHVAAVRRGAPSAFIIGDMPFLSFRKGLEVSVAAVELLVKAGAQAVKLEGAKGNLSLVRHLVESGVPVMGHLGLTPQSVHALGGYRLQATSEKGAETLVQDAQALEEAGVFALVLEMVPSELAARVANDLQIPTIGIGAGAATDGQVLVLHDLLGMNPDWQPRFLRTYLDGAGLIVKAVDEYAASVHNRSFPGPDESF
jgi:3-methyl-2-oxobutanoate hydroxymethyltransferase